MDRIQRLGAEAGRDAGDDGQWIPTTSIEQQGATLAKWFGVPSTALAQVFPNLPAFAGTDLGFLA